jgi:putative methionine-R-sulfoxide reductase with GAF domain
VDSSLRDVTKAPNYLQQIDGIAAETVLAVSLDAKTAIVLRGKQGAQVFSAGDLASLTAVSPMITRGLVGDAKGRQMAARLCALLEVVDVLSGVMDLDALILTIMERACLLFNTERCSLFLVDIEKQELVSCFQGGLDRHISIPFNRGIVGHTVTTGSIVNIPDAYNDPRFNQSVDMKTGFRTQMLLTVPIYNNRREITGVTEMINKRDQIPFDDEDIRIFMAFNVFCGISLDNAKLYQSSLDLARQLRSFVEMSSSLNTANTVQDVLRGISRPRRPFHDLLVRH